MNEQTVTDAGQRRSAAVTGIVLIGMGTLFLLSRFLELGLLLLPLLAVGFLLAGIVTRAESWFVPAGIVGGIGLGVVTIERMALGGDGEGGLFLLCFAAGWASITLLARLFSGKAVRWPLIPAGVLALIGAALLAGEQGGRVLEQLFNVFSYAWPIALVAAGIALLRKPRS